MPRYLFFLLSLALPLLAQAQTGKTAPQGKVTVVQDKAIDDLVYNKKKPTTPKAEKNSAAKPKPPAHPEAGHERGKAPESSHAGKTATPQLNQGSYKARQRYNAQGYRVQIYTGGNTRKDKQAALRMKQKCQKSFPELAAYVHFVSPRWVCRVGDFRHKEDAQRYARKIRAKKFTFEARVVTSNILVAQ